MGLDFGESRGGVEGGGLDQRICRILDYVGVFSVLFFMFCFTDVT